MGITSLLTCREHSVNSGKVWQLTDLSLTCKQNLGWNGREETKMPDPVRMLGSWGQNLNQSWAQKVLKTIRTLTFWHGFGLWGSEIWLETVGDLPICSQMMRNRRLCACIFRSIALWACRKILGLSHCECWIGHSHVTSDVPLSPHILRIVLLSLAWEQTGLTSVMAAELLLKYALEGTSACRSHHY